MTIVKPDWTDLNRDIAAAAAAREKGEYWCWRCARFKERPKWAWRRLYRDVCEWCEAGIFPDTFLHPKPGLTPEVERFQRMRTLILTRHTAEVMAEANRVQDEILRRHGLHDAQRSPDP